MQQVERRLQGAFFDQSNYAAVKALKPGITLP